jgi:hypothetical protein
MEEDDLYPPLESLSEDFTHFEIIGMGKFGQVYRVTSNKTGNIFVSFWSIVLFFCPLNRSYFVNLFS